MRPKRIRIRGILRLLERHSDMALRREIIQFIRLHLLNDTGKARTIAQIAMMQHKLAVTIVRILIEMVDAARIEY